MSEIPRPTHLNWAAGEWRDKRCGCVYHPDDDNGTHGGGPHIHPCELHGEPPEPALSGVAEAPPGSVARLVRHQTAMFQRLVGEAHLVHDLLKHGGLFTSCTAVRCTKANRLLSQWRESLSGIVLEEE